MRLIVARHGETLYNAQGRFSGQLDMPLSARGEQQAEVLGQRLALEKLDVVVASDLQRARSTAQAIARHHGLPVKEDLDLREVAFGAWEGETYAEVVARDPAWVARWESNPIVTAPPGGETVAQLHQRVTRALERWRGRYPQSTMLWMVHGGVIEVLLCHLLGIDLLRRYEFRHDNAALSEIAFRHEEAVIIRLNDTRHLLE